MKAFALSSFDSAPAVQELSVPEVGPGQVRVRIVAAALNGIDTAISTGMAKDWAEYAFPVVVGRDGAGIVDAVGEGVDHLAEDDEVLGHVLWGSTLQDGTFAEYALLPGDAVIPKPASLDFRAAGALPLAGAAALAAVDAADPKPGEKLLVAGASGGVGSFAVQLAAARGATVIATGLPEDVERLRDLGAADVVDYRQEVAAQVREVAGEGVDALIDLVSYDPDTFGSYAAAVRKGRVASTTNSVVPEALAERGLTGTNVRAEPNRETLARLIEEIERGTLRVDVEQALPLDEAAKGLETFANGHVRGKIVIDVGG